MSHSRLLAPLSTLSIQCLGSPATGQGSTRALPSVPTHGGPGHTGGTASIFCVQRVCSVLLRGAAASSQPSVLWTRAVATGRSVRRDPRQLLCLAPSPPSAPVLQACEHHRCWGSSLTGSFQSADRGLRAGACRCPDALQWRFECQSPLSGLNLTPTWAFGKKEEALAFP